MEKLRNGNLLFWLLWSFLIILNVIILIITVVSACLLDHEMDNVFTEKDKFINSTKKFQSYFNTMTGVEKQIDKIPSWVYSIVAFAESSYRKNGIEKGFLQENEYVRFDEKIFYETLKGLCAKNYSTYCGVVEYGGSPELLYYLHQYYGNEFSKAISPEGYSNKIDKNPISFEVKGIQSVYTKTKAKFIMRETSLPLTLSFGIYLRRYKLHCDNTYGYKCPEGVPRVSCSDGRGGECITMTYNPYSNSGVYDYVGDLHYTNKHSVLVVGWNDERRIDRSWGNNIHNFFDGGYIVKNSYGFNHGHSIRYWLQLHSIMEEMQVCPNVKSFEQWTPMDVECITNHTYLECCSNIIKKGKNAYIKETITRLKCNSTYNKKYEGIFTCDESKVYFVAERDHTFGPYSSYGQMDITPIDNDLFSIKLLQFDDVTKDEEPLKNMREIIIKPAFPEMLEEIFTPSYLSDTDSVKNSEECGYSFIPYKVLSVYNDNYVVDGLHAPAFSKYDINWDDKSYANSKTEGVDYSAVISATKKVVQTNFTGPYDFN